MMRVKVDKQVILRFYVYVREAERSLHSALSCAWSELRRGYPQEKIESFHQVIRELIGNTDLGEVDPRQSEALADRLAAAKPNAFRVIFRFWVWKRAQTFCFGAEVPYVASILKQIISVLTADTPPPREMLIALRMRMCDVERITRFRCCAIDDLPSTRMIWSVQDRAWRKKHGLPLDDIAWTV